MHRSMRAVTWAVAYAMLPLAVTMAANPAFAQQAGVYTGTNSEGYEVEVVVSPTNGGLAVTGGADTSAVYCHGQQVATYGIIVGLDGQPIVDGKANVKILSANVSFHNKVTFQGNEVTGTIRFAVPIFDTTNQLPGRACAARSVEETFTATLGDSDFHVPPAGTAIAVPVAATRK